MSTSAADGSCWREIGAVGGVGVGILLVEFCVLWLQVHGSRKEPQMGHVPQVLDTLATAFRLLTTGPNPLAVHGREVHPDLPARLIPLDELRDLLLADTTTNAVRNAALAVLIRRAKQERGAWIVGLGGVLLPGLRGVAGRLARRFLGDTEDIDAEVLAGFLDALDRLEPTGGHLASRLLGPAYRHARRLRLVEFEQTLPRIPDSVAANIPARPWGHPDFVLAWAVKAGAITAREAELIGATRLEDVDLVIFALAEGCSIDVIRHRRHRAERRLVRFLQSEPNRLS
jgi:hypothetical protein